MNNQSRIRTPSTKRPSTGNSNRDERVMRRSKQIVRCQSANNKPSTASNTFIDVQTQLLNSMAKDYTPYDNPVHLKNPPILPASRDPTVQPAVEYKSRLRTRQSCPQWVIDNNDEKSIFDKSGLNVNIEEKDQKEFCKAFLGRNRESLWKYDTKYIGKTPRTVYKEIVCDPTMMTSKLSKFYYKEQLLKCSTSERMGEILQNSFPARTSKDPTLLSLSTSRNQRMSRRFDLLQNAHKEMSSGEALRYRRGHCHEPEFKNFANLTAHTLKNKASACKR